MKVLFDQGTPVPLRTLLAGHTVETVYERGWSKLSNGDLLTAAQAFVRAAARVEREGRAGCERARGARRSDLHPGEGASAGARREPAPHGEGRREGARADAVRRFQRPRRCGVRQEGGFLPPRSALVEPDDPRRLAAGDDEPRGEGKPNGKGPAN